MPILTTLEERLGTSLASVVEVVGFDLGHSGTRTARRYVKGADNPDQLAISGRQNQPTAIRYDQQGTPVIGHAAIMGVSAEMNLTLGFKAPPSNDPRYRKLMRDWVKAIYDIHVRDKQIEGGAETCFIVCCPSGWSEEWVQQYQALLTGAGVPLLAVARESRAALMEAYESQLINLGEAEKRVLMIDLGSLTADISLLSGREERPYDDGGPLGASLIDKAILEYTLARHKDRARLQDAFERYPGFRARCEYHCRLAKEEYFNGPELYQTWDSPVDIGTVNVQNRYQFKAPVCKPMMEEILSQPLVTIEGRRFTWPDALRWILQRVKQRLRENKSRPETIVLVGGASQMGFVGQICSEVFSDVPWRRGKEPVLSVSLGLARVGRVDILTIGFVEEIRRFLDSELPGLVQELVPVLTDALSKALAKSIIDRVIMPCLKEWRDGKLATINDMSARVQQSAQVWLQSDEARQQIGEVVSEWLTGPVQRKIAERTNPICSRYRLPTGSLTLTGSTFLPSSGGVSALGVSDPTVLSGLITAIVGIIIYILGFVIMAILEVTGPIGWIISLVLIVVATIGGATAVYEWMQNRNIPVSLRKVTLSDGRLEKNLGEMRSKTEDQLRETFKAKPELTAQMVEEISRELREALEKTADRARYLAS